MVRQRDPAHHDRYGKQSDTRLNLFQNNCVVHACGKTYYIGCAQPTFITLLVVKYHLNHTTAIFNVYLCIPI